MTVLLVLTTLIIFLTVDHLVERYRKRATALQPWNSDLDADVAFPQDLRLATNHTWMRHDEGGIITVGIDRFLARLLGTVRAVVLPSSGAMTTPEKTEYTLINITHALRLASPVHGRVIQVNKALTRRPSLLTEDPYGAGWLVKVKSPRGLCGMKEFEVKNPIAWLRDQSVRAREFFAARTLPGSTMAMQDGGQPVEGILNLCHDPVAWDEFGKSFVTLQRTADEDRY